MQLMRSWIAAAGVALAATTLTATAQETTARSAVPRSATPADAVQQKDYGTGRTWFSTVDAWAAKPYSPGLQFFHSGSSGGLFCNGGTESRAVAQIQVPHGVTLDVLRVWTFDASGTEEATVELESACLPDFDPGQPTRTTLASVSSGAAFNSGEFSNFDFLPADTIADNQSCTYRVLVQLASATGSCPSANVGFYKARVGWLRRIPPAPAVASFGDVPTSDPFFQVIEALNASGITQGCGGGNFCPTAPVTRAAMAAFLARALGLPATTIVDPANP